MKKFSFSVLTITILSFLLIYSCSTEEENSSVPTVQTPEPEEQVKQYTLTVSSAEGGTVSTEGGTYDDGTEVTITATPNEGYSFVRWDGLEDTSNEITVLVSSKYNCCCHIPSYCSIYCNNLSK